MAQREHGQRSSVIRIADRDIGPGCPALVVAELSANHRQDYAAAAALVEAAAACGADAVKLQTYTPDTMTLDAAQPWFHINEGPWAGRSLYSLYCEAHTPWEWHARLQELAHTRGLLFFSSPFDETAVDFLESLAVPAYKVASFELTDHPLLRKVAAAGKPVLLSTGMASETEIAAALGVLRGGGAGGVVLLKCTSAYPAPAEDANLNAMHTLAERFGCLVGLSDHTMLAEVAVAAVAMGACVIEKHLTLDRTKGGPDAGFSLEPAELAAMVQAVRRTEAALGDGLLRATPSEEVNLTFRRSIVAVADIKAGEAFSPQNIRVLRPAVGLAPEYYDAIIGKRAAVDIARGAPVLAHHIAG